MHIANFRHYMIYHCNFKYLFTVLSQLTNLHALISAHLTFSRSNSLIEGHNMSPRQNLHRGSDGMAMDDSQGMYSRTNEAGPLIIPNYVLANQKYRQSSHTKSSAESLVEKVLE